LYQCRRTAPFQGDVTDDEDRDDDAPRDAHLELRARQATRVFGDGRLAEEQPGGSVL
jgi:hypothetical protein